MWAQSLGPLSRFGRPFLGLKPAASVRVGKKGDEESVGKISSWEKMTRKKEILETAFKSERMIDGS
ncbi:MAG: hypothetical protein AAGK05_18410, partial [Pseudomonadota bacterium]